MLDVINNELDILVEVRKLFAAIVSDYEVLNIGDGIRDQWWINILGPRLKVTLCIPPAVVSRWYRVCIAGHWFKGCQFSACRIRFCAYFAVRI